MSKAKLYLSFQCNGWENVLSPILKKAFCFVRFCVLSCSFVLLGCEGSANLPSILENYIDDLNRYEQLSITSPELRFPHYSLPSHRMKQQTLTQFDIGLIEFLSLQQCDLGLLVGEKNSVLGKVMPNSQRFLYEVRVIKALNECNTGSAALQEKLKNVAVTKRDELKKAYANAMFNSEETDVFYSFSNGYLPFSENQSSFQSLRISLDALARLGEMVVSKESAAGILKSGIVEGFEQHFKVIGESEYAGRLLLTLLLLTDHLNIIAEKLSLLETTPAFCRGPMTFLKQQFKVHYVEKIQPYMARVNKSAYGVLASLAVIRRSSAIPSAELSDFITQFSMKKTNEAWSQYQQSAQQHAGQWNRLLRSCQLF